ncbi:MAG: hypothetical protein FWC17_06425 [Treponema sp.]|nr:hypothetical protein [Treponema sp.]
MSAFIKRKTRLIPVLLVFFLSLIPLSADTTATDIFHWSFSGSLFYFAADNGVDSDPAPILPVLGFSAGWRFWGPLRIELTEDIYFTNYQLNTEHGYPMACNQEERSAFVLGFITGIQLTGYIPIGRNGIGIRIYGGPAADLRVVLLAFGLNHPSDFQGDERDAQLQTDAIRDYFWSESRWFMPVFGVGMDFPVSEHFKIGFDLRAWFPVYKLWTNDNTPAIDGWRFGAGVRITPRNNS